MKATASRSNVFAGLSRFAGNRGSRAANRPLFRVGKRRFAIFNGAGSPPRPAWNSSGRSLHFLADPLEVEALVRIAVSHRVAAPRQPRMDGAAARCRRCRLGRDRRAVGDGIPTSRPPQHDHRVAGREGWLSGRTRCAVDEMIWPLTPRAVVGEEERDHPRDVVGATETVRLAEPQVRSLFSPV